MSRNWDKGDLIMGRYRLVSKLGQGGMGSVWRAEHVELKNQVAVKLLDPAIARNPEMIARFLREARAAASLQNRHVIQIFDHGVEDGEAFMVMELLEGETIGERLERGPLGVEETIKFMVQVMRAMGRAHDAGIIHRDLKPDNIFITSDDDGEYAKVLDFGVAKVGGDLGATNGVKTQTGMMLGTPFYMSPEQAKAKKVDARTDVWALAVITYECLVGKRPFTGESFADLVLTLCNAPIPIPSQAASVPVGFDEWFVHGTQRDVDKRFRSARDMAAELVQLADARLTGTLGSFGSVGGTGRTPARTPVRTPARTPAAGTPKRSGERMSMTTGQSAAVGYDRATGKTKSRGNGLWILSTAAMLLLTTGVGAYAWKTSQAAQRDADSHADAEDARQASERASKAAERGAPEAENDRARLNEDDSATARIEPARIEPASADPKAEAQAPAADQQALTEQPSQASTPAAKSADKSSKDRHAADSKASTTTGSTAAGVKPATSGTVPVVDKQALPPEQWEF